MTDNTQELDEQIDSLVEAVANGVRTGYVVHPTENVISPYHAKFRIKKLVAKAVNEARIVTGETSDGYHTFNELYDYRRTYNAALFNQWAEFMPLKYDVHKSWRHSDGEECFGGGWFIVMAELPTGQISNHYQAEYWDDFQIPEKPKANEYDGHTPKQALERLAQLQSNTSKGDK